MNTNFSFHRIGLLLRRDWIEYKRNIVYMLLSIVGVMIFFFWISNGQEAGQYTDSQHRFYILGSLGCLIYFFSFTERKVHRSKGLFLTLPSSTLEKFITLLLNGAIIFLIFNIVYWAGILVTSFFIPNYLTIDIATIQGNISSGRFANLNIAGFFFFIISMIFLSYITFKKHAFAIAMGGFLLLGGLITGTAYLVVQTMANSNPYTKGYCIYSEIYPMISAANILFDIFTPAMFIASAIVIYVAYLKLKEKELR